MNLNPLKKSVTAVIVWAAVSIPGNSATIRRIGLEEGLPNATIVDLAQDKKGFIWLASKQGLCRFDGNRFINYTTANSRISGNELNAILADPHSNELWVATERDGLNRFNPESHTFQSFRHDSKNPASVSSDEITALSASARGGIWVANYSSGVDYFDPRTNKFSHFNARTIQGMPQGHIWSLCEGKQGNLYVGHLRDGLTVISIKEKTARNFRHIPQDPSSIPDNEIICLFIDPRENIWVGTRNGLALYNPMTGNFRSFRHHESDHSSLLSNQIYDISYKAGNELWITCRMGGVSILNLDQDLHNSQQQIAFRNIPAGSKNSQLSSIHVCPVLIDCFGNAWIGFEGDGLNCLPHEPPLFTVWENTPAQDPAQRLRGDIPLSLCLQSGRDIWVGEDAAGVDFFSSGVNQPEKTKAINRILDHTIVQSIFKDSEGSLWFGTFRQGIVHYNPETKNLYTLNPDPSVPLHIRCMYEDRKGIVWIGTHHGIYLYHPDSRTFSKPPEINQAIRDNILRSITGDSSGAIYVATFGKGLTRFSLSGEMTGSQDVSKGFPSNAIHVLFCDSQGEIWAGTRKGLVHFKLEKGKINLNHYTVYNEHNGLANACIRSIEEDRYGNLWISTNTGISRFHRDQKTFYNYSWEDGLPRGEFQDGASVCDEAGILYFASRGGVVSFNPSDFYKEYAEPKAAITEVLLHGRQNELQEQSISIPGYQEEIKLSYDKNTLSIAFGVVDYAFANRVEFAYKLEGLDKEWYNCKEQSVTFRNLPPGKYNFHLKYRFKGKEWIELAHPLALRILPPWWLTGWAKCGYLLALLLVSWGLFRIYHRRQQLESSLLIETEKHQKDQEVHNERLVFFTNIAHELRTPLTLIIGPLEDLINDRSASSAWRSRISMVYRNATRLRELTNQILEFRKTETRNRKLCVQFGNPLPAAKEIILHFIESNRNPHLQITYGFPHKEPAIWYDKEVLSIILNNLLSNALKYTNRGEIALSAESREKDGIPYLVFQVKDTGEGIPETELPHIFDRYYQAQNSLQTSGTGIGLALVKNLIDLHHAQITVESEFSKGSQFAIWLPQDYDYPEVEHILPAAEKPPKDETTPGKNENIHVPTILLVEDHKEIREYIEETLRGKYRILTAGNGREGIEKAYSHTPDLIISDILMPLADGIELCKTLKNDIRTSHIPVILLTAKDSAEDKSRGYEAGADSYLTKPFSSTLLEARISNLFHARASLMESWKKYPFVPLLEKKGLSQIDREFLQNLTSLIENRISSNDIDISFIVEKLHISHSTLYRKTKALTGLTINAFILKIRMLKAAELLGTSQFTILEVMYHVGINTPSYFRRCFKEAFGCLPSEYKASADEQ